MIYFKMFAIIVAICSAFSTHAHSLNVRDEAQNTEQCTAGFSNVTRVLVENKSEFAHLLKLADFDRVVPTALARQKLIIDTFEATLKLCCPGDSLLPTEAALNATIPKVEEIQVNSIETPYVKTLIAMLNVLDNPKLCIRKVAKDTVEDFSFILTDFINNISNSLNMI